MLSDLVRTYYTYIKAAPAARLARLLRRAQPVPRPARRTPGHAADGTQINSAHSASKPLLLGGRLPRHMIIQLAATASWALPAVASNAIGFADPRPGVHSPGLASIEEDRGRAGYGDHPPALGVVPSRNCPAVRF